MTTSSRQNHPEAVTILENGPILEMSVSRAIRSRRSKTNTDNKYR
jgi:hypothetical protein